MIYSWFDGKKGRFLDIGSNNGVNGSATHQLVLDGWSGVYFEPSPNLYRKLVENLNTYDSLIFNELAVVKNSYEESKIEFFDFVDPVNNMGSFFGSIYEYGVYRALCDLKALDESGVRVDDIFMQNISNDIFITEVNTIKTEDVFKKYGYDFDFIKIDAEYASGEILKDLPFKELSPCLICVEIDYTLKDYLDIAESNGLHFLGRMREDVFMCKY